MSGSPVVLKPEDCKNSLHRDDEISCVICEYRALRQREAEAIVKKHEHDESGRYKGRVLNSSRVIVKQYPKKSYIPKIARVQKARKEPSNKTWPEAQIPHDRNILDWVHRKPSKK